MNTIEVYQVHTEKGLIFFLDVSEDAEGNGYLGEIATALPLDQAWPGKPPDFSGYPRPEECRDQNKDELIRRCKERITELGGEITVCRKAIDRTERGLSIAGTRITIYQLMDYLKADEPTSVIKDLFKLSDEDMPGVLEGVLKYVRQYADKHQGEYEAVLRKAEEIRIYWEERNRDRLQAIAQQPPKPGAEETRAKIEKKKAELGIR